MDENIILSDNVDSSDFNGIDIIEFLKQVSNYDVASSLESYFDRIFDILKAIYSDENYRHSYYEISNFLEKTLTPDERDLLSQNILKIYDELNERISQNDDYKKIYKNVLKLSDHISLEILRINRMQQIKFIGDKALEEYKENQDIMYKYKKRAKKLETKISGFHSQSITILGIFSGFVVAFVMSGHLILDVISVINDVALHKLVYVTLLLAFIIFNIIYLLMYSISKISGNSMTTECIGKQCLNCGNCKTPLGRLKKKYPIVFWFNFLVLTVIFFMSAFYIFLEMQWFQEFLQKIGFIKLQN